MPKTPRPLAELEPLPPRFLQRPTLVVARHLLGCLLVRVEGRRLLVTRIVETEAYVGQNDKACHAAGGKTPRNEIMFRSPGTAYVYFTYGMHHCLNVVTEEEGFPAAVLLRAAEPVQGLEAIRARRGGRTDRELLSGPGRLCQGLAIDRELNAVDLTAPDSPVWLAEGAEIEDDRVATSGRIGISERAGEARYYPWRFFERGSPFVSKGRPAVQRKKETRKGEETQQKETTRQGARK